MRIKNLVFAGILTAVGCVSMGVMTGGAQAAVTCPSGSLRDGESVNSYAECNLPKQEKDDPTLMGTIKQVLNVIVGVVGLLAVIVIIIGGIYFVTSQGDATKVARGRNTILYGVIGLIVALLAFAIVNFVLSSVFNNNQGTSGGGSSSSSSSGGN